ncbi:hypothetical protein ACIPWI_06825 [Streptomyces sp. NPDC090046]|uniref:hypothetical protein n=1 Tax=Streptomyces sp. NPDC090046 TaxID=3365928 RepID=UPI00381A494E
MLFLSNLLSMVFAGMVVFAALGFSRDGGPGGRRAPRRAAQKWLSDSPGAAVTSVDAQSRTLYVHVRSPGALPPVADLLDDLEGQVPDGVPIVVDAARGQQIIAGKVGD